MVDIRYVILAVILLGSALFIYHNPKWATPVLVALAIGTLAVILMWPRP